MLEHVLYSLLLPFKLLIKIKPLEMRLNSALVSQKDSDNGGEFSEQFDSKTVK